MIKQLKNKHNWDVVDYMLWIDDDRQQNDEPITLNICNLKLKKILRINNLTRLEILNCSSNKITSLEDLGNSSTLKFLNCSFNNLTSLKGIENLSRLEILNCSDNIFLQSLEHIQNLTSLINLRCVQTKIESCNYLENLVNLTHLNISENKLSSLSGIQNLINLKYLQISSNKLDSLSGIENLINLVELNCSHNIIESLAELKDCTSLIKLNCSYNKIKSLNPIKNLINLVELDCSNNLINLFNGTENLTKLRIFDCKYNPIKSLNGLLNLTKLVKLSFDGKLIDHVPPNVMRKIKELNNITNNKKRAFSKTFESDEHNIKKSVIQSVNNILEIKPTFTMSEIKTLIMNDDVLTEKTKQLLFEYMDSEYVCSQLGVTFGELSLYVFNRIINNENFNQIKESINLALAKSNYGCFALEFCEFINCLSGYDELVNC